MPPEKPTKHRDSGGLHGLLSQQGSKPWGLRRLVVIVGEAHNARTDLSFDTLGRLSPSLIVELTAEEMINLPASFAAGPGAAVRACPSHAAKSHPLWNVVMPPGMSGINLKEQLNAEGLKSR